VLSVRIAEGGLSVTTFGNSEKRMELERSFDQCVVKPWIAVSKLGLKIISGLDK
jgi:hypothetical protein